MNQPQQAPQLQLRDIHLPPPVSWWPPAPGWWILAILTLVLAMFIIYAISRYRRHAYRRTGLRQLARLEKEFNTNGDNAHLLQGLSKLLRHMAILHYPPQQCAGLCGSEWLKFLDQPFINRKKQSQPFSMGVGRILIDYPYRAAQQQEQNTEDKKWADELISLARLWLKKLPVPPREGGAK